MEFVLYLQPFNRAGRREKRLSPRDLRPDLAVAGPPQERAQASQVLPVRLRPEGRLCVRQPLPLRAGGQPRDRPHGALYTGAAGGICWE